SARAVPAVSRPPPEALRELDALVELGYPRGILAHLAEIEHAHPECAEFVGMQRDLARQFQFEAMRELLTQAGH
ncbi:MAG TPA: hypothetical protein PLR02_15810, partial [Rhodocyclaceae bacterium]|nr:hypothetical protein [Rhodocyclaceae bacterium]